MKRKKNPLIDLERYRVHFFLIGLALSLAAVIGVFGIKFYEKEKAPRETIIVDSDEIVIPITTRQPPKVKSAVPQQVPEKIEVVDNITELDQEFDMSATETDENEMIISENTRFVEGDVEVISSEEEEIEEPIPFAIVESVPVFPGCEDLVGNDKIKACFQQKLLEFVGKNYIYSEAARELKLSGRIIVQFVVEKNGSVSNIQILRGVDPWLDEEAVRVLQSLPRIQPARQRGQPVRISFVVPINIQLRE